MEIENELGKLDLREIIAIQDLQEDIDNDNDIDFLDRLDEMELN